MVKEPLALFSLSAQHIATRTQVEQSSILFLQLPPTLPPTHIYIYTYITHTCVYAEYVQVVSKLKSRDEKMSP